MNFVGNANWKNGANWDIQADLEKSEYGFLFQLCLPYYRVNYILAVLRPQGWQVEVPQLI